MAGVKSAFPGWNHFSKNSLLLISTTKKFLKNMLKLKHSASVGYQN